MEPPTKMAFTTKEEFDVRELVLNAKLRGHSCTD